MSEKTYNTSNTLTDTNLPSIIPQGVIDTIDDLDVEYHLTQIIGYYNLVKNAGHILQTCEFYQYILNHYYVFGSIQFVLRKDIFIHYVSVIETLVIYKGFNLEYKDKNNEPIRMKNLLDNNDFCKKVPIESNLKQEILSFYNKRNKIHLNRAPENELTQDDFSQDDIDQVRNLLKRISDLLYTH